MFTEKQKHKYLQDKGRTCPYCESSDIASSPYSVHIDSLKAYQGIECEDCGKKWRNCYNLVDIQEIDNEKGED